MTMATAAIRTASMSKRYRIGQRVRLQDAAGEPDERCGAADFAGRPSGAEPGKGFVWALKDVSFDVAPGELVGIIGRNGAGKTRAQDPLADHRADAGWAEVRGRVGTLLEVGTGFHPELTGRENVYPERRDPRDARSGDRAHASTRSSTSPRSSNFLDTPVKRYSSGM